VCEQDVKAVESSSGSTALHVAAEEGCLEAVRHPVKKQGISSELSVNIQGIFREHYVNIR
jgi:hypothetical protein